MPSVGAGPVTVMAGGEADVPLRLRAIRGRLGLTQVRLAELMGVSYATVNRWENGQTRPSALAMNQIIRAETFGLDGLRPDFTEPMPQAGLEPSIATPPPLDFTADPAAVSLVSEAERLTWGHLFNPAFATEVSLIDPLPHQRIAVYERMLGQNPLRFLLADDAGAGKTIMAGLYIREMLARRLIRRVLVVPPAGLVGNWERELRRLFSLHFRIVAGTEARTRNPFDGPDSDRIVVSLDTLSGERMFARLQEAAIAPYDLVIFDEAHKLSARREPDFRISKTDRYKLAEALAGLSDGDPRWNLEWRAHHLMLLTATPHMGKDFPYYCLWRLLQPEALPTLEAFNAFPPEARQRHFARRTKEEMVRLDGSPLYPTRISDTLSYDLTQGENSEQTLYDRTTDYMGTYYNRARILNRSAARLAMSVFQRRLASSTFALMRSFERRIEKLDTLIQDVRAGRITLEQLDRYQQRLDVEDVLDERTADEEAAVGESEQNEAAEEEALGAVVAVSLAELEAERQEVQRLRDLARQVYELGEESKFEKLAVILRGDAYRDHKLILFTEHRDTLLFLVRRLEGLGFAGQVASIHGSMDHEQRDEQVEFFRKPRDEGGATYLVATDAAGEGINLQFCWLMVNYDIPWNPARLEQRMGRIHRYGQKHDPVVILNLVAGKTREGRVLKTLLDKLETIRKQLGSDKVFDVIGRLFEQVSIKQYMEEALTEAGAEGASGRLESSLTKEQVEALQEREKRLYGDGGEIRSQLPGLRQQLDREELRRLLPGYVRRFVEKAAPALDMQVEGDLGGSFHLRPLKQGALDPLWPVLETYSERQRARLTVYRPDDREEAVFLHPGEPLFDVLRERILARLGTEALKGAVFIDPTAREPWLFHLTLVEVVRRADATPLALRDEERLECQLIGLRQYATGAIEECPVEYLLLLKGAASLPPSAATLASVSNSLRDLARAHAVEQVAQPLAERWRLHTRATGEEREQFLIRGFDYQEAELAAARAALNERVRGGDARAKPELNRVKDRQRALAERRGRAVAALRREPDLVDVGPVTVLAHALVVPSARPEDRRRYDEEIERVAAALAQAYEEAQCASVRDVSKPALARAAGLTDCPGFDLLSKRPDGSERGIEVKGRAAVGDVELTENEWAKACNLRERYWLYVAYDCASPNPRLFRVRDPFGRLMASPKGGVLIDERAILQSAEGG